MSSRDSSTLAAAQNGITAVKPWRADFFPDTSRSRLAPRHISALNAPWTKHLSQLDTHPSRRTTAQQGPDWPHELNRSSHPVKHKGETVTFCSGRHAAECLSLPPSPRQTSSTSELGFKAEFGSAAPPHLCTLNDINRAAPAPTCYSESVTFGLSIKPQILRITGFVMIHITTSLCSSNTKILL